MTPLVAAGGFWAVHGAHALMGAVSFAVVLVVVVIDRARTPEAERQGPPMATQPIASRARVAVPLAALGLAAAGVVHAVVLPEHVREGGALYAAFFLGSAAVQFTFAVALLRRPTRVLLAGAVVLSVSILLLWAWTRTFGVPLGPHRGDVEKLGVLDGLAGGDELMTAVAAGVALARLGAGGLRPARLHPAVGGMAATLLAATLVAAVVAPPA